MSQHERHELSIFVLLECEGVGTLRIGTGCLPWEAMVEQLSWQDG